MDDTPHFRHLICNSLDGVLVLTIAMPEVRSDDQTSGLAAELTAALNYYNPTKVVIDLQHVQAIGSAGFGAIAGFHQELVHARNGQDALCGLNPKVREMLEVIRFIVGGGSVPILDTAKRAETTTRPQAKPLFEIVGKNVQAAVDRLNAAS